MDKYARLLALVEEYNDTHGQAHSAAFLEAAADVVHAELVWDGWYCNGFGVDGVGYFPVH